MLGNIQQLWAGRRLSQAFFGVYAAILLACLFLGVATEQYYLAGIPAFILLVYLAVVDFRMVFFLLIACIPLSTEIHLPNGLSTDLPDEPLMVGLMLVGGLFALRHYQELDGRYLRHPLTLFLLLHLAWIAVTAITSQEAIVSIKFFLSKIWYVAVFYFLAGRLLEGERNLRIFFWAAFIPLLFTVVVIIVRHAGYGFSFADVFRVMHPFYRNHVNYASLIALLLPFAWYMRKWYRAYSWPWLVLTASLVLLVVAIQLSYTRAAYLAVFIAIGAHFIIRWRLVRYVLVVAVITAVGLVAYLAQGNRYLDYAPNYETTITHYDFNKLIAATSKMEDISTMERVYRWVAGFQMTEARPVFGFGPGNFYTFYRSYTVTSFQTYVSDNPEGSGIHSYYLMTLVEQGLPGLIIFLLLCGYALLRGEAIYHRAANEKDRHITMMALLSFIVILALLIINDLVETDKIGSFFFMNLALLVNLDLKRADQPTAAPD
jgi:O-antigen ligase